MSGGKGATTPQSPVEIGASSKMNSNTKPTPPLVEITAIPEGIKGLSQWVVWQYEWNGKKWTKVPYDASTGAMADSTKSKTWSDFAQALCVQDSYDGIGFVVTKDDPYMGIDLDDCLNEPWALDMIEDLDSYTEITPSGDGYRVWVEASKPDGMGCKKELFHDNKVEVYDHSRYFTVTGQVCQGRAAIEPRQSVSESVLAPLMKVPVEVNRQASTALTDESVVDLLKNSPNKNRAYYLYASGSDADDHSSCDLALCNDLAWACGRDPEQMDRVFRRSALMRPKWDRVHSSEGLTYGQMTLQAAIASTVDAYTPMNSAQRKHKTPVWAYKKKPEFYPVDQIDSDNILVKYSIEAARATEFPAGSAMFVCLGAFSAAASMAYCTQYQDGTRMPLGIYTSVEQPPSTAKSRMLNTFLKPVNKKIDEINRGVIKNNNIKLAQDKDAELEPVLTNVLSNTTAEGLEKQLVGNGSGRFIIASAEQGAANQILAVDTAGRTTDKDLILKGYNGEYHSSSRVTRSGFSGEVYGSVTLIAQQGMTKKILKASGGEGLAERFLFLSEPHLLGKRTFDTEPVNELLKASYEQSIQSLINDFEFLGRPRSIDDCHSLKFTDEAYKLLNDHRITIEPMLADYVSRGQMLLVSALGKCDIHTMKIAVLLHLASNGVQETIVESPVEASTVESALDIVMLQFKQLERILEREGETGEAAAREAVLRKFNSRSTRKMSELFSDLKNVKPFKDMSEPYQAAKLTVEEMLRDGELIRDYAGTLSAA